MRFIWKAKPTSREECERAGEHLDPLYLGQNPLEKPEHTYVCRHCETTYASDMPPIPYEIAMHMN